MNNISSLLGRVSNGLYWNASFQLLSQVFTGFTGMIFWLLAARMFPAEELGVPTSLVSTVVFLSLLAGLGVEVTLSRYFPVVSDRKNFFLKLMGWSTLSTLLAGVIVVLFSSVLVPDFYSVFFEAHALSIAAILFVLFSVVRGMAKNVDGLFIAEKRSEFAFARTFVFDVSKLLLLFYFLSLIGPLGTFWSWGVGVCISVVAGLILVQWKIRFKQDSGKKSFNIPARELIQFSLVNLVAWNFSLVVGNLLPLLVLAWVGPAEAAIFFFAWILGSYLMVVPTVFSRSFLVEAVHNGSQSVSFLWKTIRMSLFVLVPALIVALAAGDWVFALFGKTYEGGGTLLFLFALSALFEIFIRVHFALLNLDRWNKPLVLLNGFRFLLLLGLAWVLTPMYGSLGLGLAWLFSSAGSAILSVAHLIQKYHLLGGKKHAAL